MTWKPISTAPRVTSPQFLPETQHAFARVIAPVLRLRDADGAEALGMWSIEANAWRFTTGQIGEPVEWDGPDPDDLSAPEEVWPFDDIPEPPGWRGNTAINHEGE